MLHLTIYLKMLLQDYPLTFSLKFKPVIGNVVIKHVYAHFEINAIVLFEKY